ncbi:MAG: hypothetical protein M3Q73_03905 [bacterium]|nr:hypothetical protein [bacterium]
MLVNGRPVPPFNIECYPPPPGDRSKVDKLKELSYLKFGKDKFIIESEILQKYKKAEPAPAAIKPVA